MPPLRDKAACRQLEAAPLTQPEPAGQAWPRFTVSAFNRRSGRPLIWRCEAEDARAARDLVLLRLGEAAVIVSVFAGHLTEPDEPAWS